MLFPVSVHDVLRRTEKPVRPKSHALNKLLGQDVAVITVSGDGEIQLRVDSEPLNDTLTKHAPLRIGEEVSVRSEFVTERNFYTVVFTVVPERNRSSSDSRRRFRHPT